MTSNDLDVIRQAAVAGAGIAWLPEVLCAADVHKDRLRRVLPEWSSDEVPVHALYSRARHLSPKVVAFLDLVAKELRLRI